MCDEQSCVARHSMCMGSTIESVPVTNARQNYMRGIRVMIGDRKCAESKERKVKNRRRAIKGGVSYECATCPASGLSM